MKVLSHALIATRMFDSKDPRLIIGSILPDIETYTQLGIFEFSEIHDGGQQLRDFLKARFPEQMGYALGMMTHSSIKGGVDHYNDKNWQGTGVGWAHLKKGPLVKLVTELYSVDPKEGEGIAHNFIELGVDLFISKKQPQFAKFVTEVVAARNEKEMIKLLSLCFEKQPKQVEKSVVMYFQHFSGADLESLAGQARVWAKMSAVLVKRPISVKEIALLIEKAYLLIEDESDSLLKEIEGEVRKERWFKV